MRGVREPASPRSIEPSSTPGAHDPAPRGGAERVYIGLGSNQGDRLATLGGAIDVLASAGHLSAIRTSGVYETRPVGGPDQPDYLNAVIEAATELSPFELLDHLQEVEARFARTRLVRWGPRTLDLDLLLYGDEVIDTSALQVPHPRMAVRGFVLEPLAELTPDLVHPVEEVTARELCHQWRKETTAPHEEVRRRDVRLPRGGTWTS